MNETSHAERRSGFSCAEHGEMSRMVRELHTAILGDVNDENKEGMKAKVKRHDDFQKGWNRFAWIFITAIIGSLVAGSFAVSSSLTSSKKAETQISNIGK